MKVAIFAGGFGTRLSEETAIRPKPMVEIGGRPIIWHIMKMYAHHGFNDFVVLGGYKVDYIRDYFLNYRAQRTDYTIDLKTGNIDWLESVSEDWRVTVLDTGADSMTGGRLKRAMHLLSDEPFCLTYGDGVSDVNIRELVTVHKASRRWCTLTAVTQPGRYGALRLNEDLNRVEAFREKGAADGGLINGGFFVCQPEVFELIDDDQTTWENEPMDRLVERDMLGSYHHKGYWQSMDSLRDKITLETAWASGAPWKQWND
ncbi:glucose-1-phosphate cytidylyltransferase [Pseudomonas daroniae]|uniref:Glucose-1-phosphate cytidylyltransferase n=1 Tax=Phytopseudomonas daroniae TaxID=2487519 RepID=A0A4Q9QJQ4_9GAMM|nr:MULTISPECIES: glucose-1-phosphate cytidylyltransferase [Pseudomonas]TBU72169.1 glucose-1-phosphate cytidylyltransferase [Pseudomonas daroniae]TBU75735.1 glucose-1-phosphate cytidylyltransferase [Pseudomonas daroniae]TBU80530.1 glucose-1-phosphate cytidylyltransferase [Pseudomonas sp. FRB 228]TBU89645.1 glucose-1-phosphate cytidylyltransferase [Pseudomonas daroniae]